MFDDFDEFDDSKIIYVDEDGKEIPVEKEKDIIPEEIDFPESENTEEDFID